LGISNSYAQTPSPYRWQLNDNDGVAKLRVSNESNIEIVLTCTGKTDPLQFSIKIPTSFAEKKEESLISIEINDETEILELLKTKLPKEQVKYRTDPNDLSSPLKTKYSKTRFVAFRDPAASDDVLDVYSIDLSKTYQGLTVLNMLRDTVTDLVVTADFGGESVGKTRISSAGSTSLSRTFNVQFCGV
jgi:hypothetical protein